MEYIIKLNPTGLSRKGQIRFVSSGPRGVQGLQGVAGQDGASFDWKGAWVTAHAYKVNEVVAQNGSSYIALTNHTSGTFSTDLAASKWQLMAQKGTDGAGAGDMTKAVYDPAGKNAQVAVDTAVVHKTGDRMTGALKIAAVTGAPAESSYPIGPSGAVSTGLNIPSSFNGGDDGPLDGGTDSTGRLNLYSYQRAYTNSFGETIRNFAMRKDAKSMTAWYMPVKTDGSKLQGYDDTTRDPLSSGIAWKPVIWTGAHYEANDHNSIHAHWEIEVPDASGALQGRFEVQFANATTGVIGLDKTYILTNLADFVVRTSNGQVLRLSSNNSNAKDIEFANATDGSARRWKLRTTNETESGSNAGSNFQFLRYDDSNTLIDQPLIINRATGQVQIGGNTGTSNGLAVNRSSGNAISIVNTGAAAGGIITTLADTNSRVLQALVSGDSVNRFAISVTGIQEWGSGSATRDTNLYRSAADTLKTDDTFVAGAGLTVGTLSGVLKATAGVVSVATAGTDFAANIKQTVPKTSGGTSQFGIPGLSFVTQGTTSMNANEVRYVPFVVKYPITLTDQQFEVTTTPASNANVRVGIYAANTDMQPTGAPLYDTAVSVATGFTGVKSTTGMALSLTPGTYLVALNVDVAMTLRTIASPSQAVSPSMGANAVIQRYTASQTYGAFPSTPTAWTTAGASTGSQQNSVFFKWSE